MVELAVLHGTHDARTSKCRELGVCCSQVREAAQLKTERFADWRRLTGLKQVQQQLKRRLSRFIRPRHRSAASEETRRIQTRAIEMARITLWFIVLVAVWAALAGAVGGDSAVPVDQSQLTFGHSLLPQFFHNYTQFNHGV